MIDTVQEIDVGGNRCVRVGCYTLDAGDGEGPERRVFIAAGWASEPPLPVHEATVDLPASKLGGLVAALEAVTEEKADDGR